LQPPLSSSTTPYVQLIRQLVAMDLEWWTKSEVDSNGRFTSTQPALASAGTAVLRISCWNGSLRTSSMNPSEAFAAIGLAAVACDGTLDGDEAAMLRQLLEVRSPYSNLGDGLMAAMFDGLLERLRSGGWEKLIMEAAPVLSPPQQETAYTMAALLVHTNRSFKPVEQQMLARLGELISVPAERCSQILEVMAVLHRDSLRS